MIVEFVVIKHLNFINDVHIMCRRLKDAKKAIQRHPAMLS